MDDQDGIPSEETPKGELIELPRRPPATAPPAPVEPAAPARRRTLTERLADAARDRRRGHPSSG
ncbi:MAG TPA: hypothetical protein VFK42_19480 [Acidimicrobiales bacterium]|jgi:hypothetical protein|nr:hypothetical protein [Acidimicrobiales bacterium]